MRTKLIVLGVAGVIAIGLLFVVFNSWPKESDENDGNIILRQDLKDNYTPEEMVQAPSVDDNKKVSNEEDKENERRLKELEQLIKENEEAFQDGNNSQREKPSSPKKETVNKPKPKPKKKTIADTVSVRKPQRRSFNSIKLIKEDESNAIRAFVHSTQTVQVGSTLKMQLAENCLTDDGHRIKKGSPVYGEVKAIDGERVIIKISSINIDNNILPFKKEVYSRDAIAGIYVPGNPKSEISKEAGASAVTGANANITGGFDMGSQLAAGAANSVINATKSATSKNIRKIKVTIKTNYQILLMEDKQP